MRTVSAGMSFPIALRGMRGGNFVLICDDSVRFFSSSGEEISVTSTGGLSLSYFDVSRNSAIAVSRSDGLGGESRVWAFDNSGAIVYNSTVDIKVIGAAAAYELSDGAAGYVTDGKSVIKLNSGGAASETADADGDILKIADTERGFLACTAEVAVRLFTGEG